LLQPFARVFADRFEHRVAARLVLEQAAADKSIKMLEGSVTNPFGRLEAAAAVEDSEPSEQPLLVSCEQAVAPLESRAQGALPLGQVTCAAGQEWEPLLEPFQKQRRSKRPGARGRKLDRQRQAIKPPADRLDQAVFLYDCVRGRCPFDE
jgi:hypothetical protein